MSLKRGKYSVAEMKYMRDNIGKVPIVDIAKYLNRSEEAVESWGLEKGLIAVKTDSDIGDKNRCLTILRDLEYWPSILESLLDKEVEYYENNWYAIFKQLGEDVSYTEHIYIKRLLLMEIDLNRTAAKDKRALQEIDQLEELIRIEMSLEDDIRDIPKLNQYKMEVEARKIALKGYVDTKEKLNKEIKTYTDKLKADRLDRREKVTSADTYWGYIAMLEDGAYRDEESYRAELGRIALEKAQKDLYGAHQYIDKTVDHPILSADSLEYYKQQHEQDEQDEQGNEAI